jgi:hypothetical protein
MSVVQEFEMTTGLAACSAAPLRRLFHRKARPSTEPVKTPSFFRKMIRKPRTQGDGLGYETIELDTIALTDGRNGSTKDVGVTEDSGYSSCA